MFTYFTIFTVKYSFGHNLLLTYKQRSLFLQAGTIVHVSKLSGGRLLRTTRQFKRPYFICASPTPFSPTDDEFQDCKAI